MPARLPAPTRSGLPLLTIALILVGALDVLAEGPIVPNAEFREGDEAPAGWTLIGEGGRWVGKESLQIAGDGRGSSHWRCDVGLTPGRLYRFEFRARGSISGGCVVSGPSFANRDHRGLSDAWQWFGHVFRAPDNMERAHLRLGIWEAKGKVQFDAVRIRPVLPVHTRVDAGGLVFGEGETIRDGRYAFRGTFGHEGSNHHRVLQAATAGFNSDRWCLSGDDQVTYRFQVPKRQVTSGQLAFNVNYHTRGACAAEVSTDGRKWRKVASLDKVGAAEAAVPPDMLPAEALWLRLRGADARSSFQVNQITFEGALDRPPPDAAGATSYAEVQAAGAIAVERVELRDDSSGEPRFVVHARNTGRKPVRVALGAEVTRDGRSQPMASIEPRDVAPGGTASLEIPTPRSAGEHLVGLTLKADGVEPTVLNVRYAVAEFYRADYGQHVHTTDRATVWWCEAGWKVPRSRPAPEPGAAGPRTAAYGEACRNDREAVQVVVRAHEELKGLTASVSPLSGPGGATIPAERVKLSYVYYHYVHTPTDKTGVRDWWPDALPPWDRPIDVPAGQNQPLWVLVHVPREAAPGDYSGTIRLAAEGFEAEVPLNLHVWDFALPDRNHLETAFGLSPSTVFRYHQLKTEADKRKVLDLYFQSFAEHRISPYDPAPLDRIRVKWLPEADPPRAEVDFSAFDPVMERAIARYHFTGFRLPIQGMGGGTFHRRYEPKIGSYGEDTPEYQAMFSSYVGQLEDHFRAKGWLWMPYIYWFDEPAPKDYEFVTRGFERLRKYAPNLRRMLTEEPGEELKAPVDIWCPVSFNYDHETAERRRARGEEFWWYVCCGPKAPYCTLFIDHAATELRVWHWQTWQRKIAGTLVWSTNYWTSSAAFPESWQNPYEDPMGYVSGYSTPKGVKRHWGNGDGRFLYPPLAAAVPGKSGPDPVIAPPVSSIRWEMLREGVEDYEYLWLLRDRIAKRRGDLSAKEARHYESLLVVPDAITKDMTTFTTDPRPIHSRRAAIARAIEELSR